MRRCICRLMAATHRSIRASRILTHMALPQWQLLSPTALPLISILWVIRITLFHTAILKSRTRMLRSLRPRRRARASDRVTSTPSERTTTELVLPRPPGAATSANLHPSTLTARPNTMREDPSFTSANLAKRPSHDDQILHDTIAFTPESALTLVSTQAVARASCRGLRLRYIPASTAERDLMSVNTLVAERNFPTRAPWRAIEGPTLARGRTYASTKDVVSSSPAGLLSTVMLAVTIPASSSHPQARGVGHAESPPTPLVAQAMKMTKTTRARKSARTESSTKARTNKHLAAQVGLVMWGHLLGIRPTSDGAEHLQVLSELLKHWQSLRMAIAAAAAMSAPVARRLLWEKLLPLSPSQLPPLQPSIRLSVGAPLPSLLAIHKVLQQQRRRLRQQPRPRQLAPALTVKPKMPLQYWVCSMSHVRILTHKPQVAEGQHRHQQVEAVII